MKKLLPLLILLFVAFQINAATYYLKTANVGTAGTPSSWNTGGVGGGGTNASNFSTSGDIFIVSNGQAATMGACTFAAGVTLQLLGTSTVTISANNTTVTMNGTVICSAASTYQFSMNASGGSGTTLAFGSGATFKTANTIGILGTNCSCQLTGGASKNSVTFNNATNFEFNGTSAQGTLGLPATVATLTINNAAGVTLGATKTVTTLTIGNVTANSLFDDGGFQITCTGILNLTSGTFSLGGAASTTWPAFATRNISAGTTVEYGSAVAQVVSTTPTYQNLTFSGAGTKTPPSGTLSIGGNWSVTGGTAALNTNNTNVTVTGNITSGNITSGSGTISVGGSWTNSGTFVCGTGTVNFTDAAQTIPSLTYNILTLSGSGTKTAGGNLTAATLNNTVGDILDMIGYTLTATTINNGSSTIKFNGASNGKAISTGTVEYYGSTQTVTTGTYSTLYLSTSGTKTAGGNLTATTLNNTGGGILDMIGFTLSVSGIINNSGSTIKFNGASNGVAISTGTVEYYGATQTLPAGNYNNLTITTSGTKTLAGATSVAGVLKINAGATLDANSRTITITGAGLSWNNLGTFIYGTSKVTMNGSSAQSMFGSTFYDLEINNTAGVSLTSSDVVTHQFILTNGNLKLGNFDLTVSGTISGSGSSSYIITDGTGTVIQNVGTSPVTFPIGLVASDYTPITFSNLGTAQNYYVRVIFVTPSLTTTGLYRQWVVKETYDSTTELGSVALAWTNNSMGTLGAPTTCDLVGNITGSPNSYDPIHSHLDGSSYSVSTGPIGYPLQNITTGLYITLVGNNKILPVELSSFTSTVNGRDISLNWTTKTEKNSNKFVIERTIADNNINNLKWDNVNSVNAAVLSNSPKYYSYTDKNLQAGKYQYRLKMIDNDGSFAYSKIVEAEVSLPKNFELSQNYPNPFNPSTKINYSLPNDARVTLEVYNIIGEKVAQIVNENQSAGYYVVNFGSSSFNNVTSGIYLYKFTAVDNTGKSFSSIKKMMLLK